MNAYTDSNFSESAKAQTLPQGLPAVQAGDAALTMSSREIADLCEKDHKVVIRDIRSMLISLYGDEHVERIIPEQYRNRHSEFVRENAGQLLNAIAGDGTKRFHEDTRGFRWERDNRGYVTRFDLDKEHALTLVAGYNVKLRKRIIDRWVELERQEAGAQWSSSSVEVTKLDKNVKNAIGGMVKRITGRLLREEIAPLITQAVRDAQRQEDMHPTVDLSSTVTAADMLDMMQTKGGFRGTTQLITRNMLKFTLKEGCWRTPAHVNRSQPWRFPRSRAQEWLFGKSLGAEIVRAYLARRSEQKDKAKRPADQTVIQFRPATQPNGGAA